MSRSTCGSDPGEAGRHHDVVTMTEPAPPRRNPGPNYVPQALEFFARMGSAEAIVHGARRYTYAETRAAVLAMATALTARRVRGSMTAAAVTRNHPESIILLLALHLLGCRAAFVPSTHRATSSVASS